MLQPIHPLNFQVGDEIQTEGFGHRYHKIVGIEGNIIIFNHAYGHGDSIRCTRSYFNGYRWFKRITEVPYDPEQMLSDEDDL